MAQPQVLRPLQSDPEDLPCSSPRRKGGQLVTLEAVCGGETTWKDLDDIRTLDDIGTDVALAEEVDSEAAISGPEEEDIEDIPRADGPEAAVSGLGDNDRGLHGEAEESTSL